MKKIDNNVMNDANFGVLLITIQENITGQENFSGK